jgi:hypothetical protein
MAFCRSMGVPDVEEYMFSYWSGGIMRQMLIQFVLRYC